MSPIAPTPTPMAIAIPSCLREGGGTWPELLIMMGSTGGTLGGVIPSEGGGGAGGGPSGCLCAAALWIWFVKSLDILTVPPRTTGPGLPAGGPLPGANPGWFGGGCQGACAAAPGGELGRVGL